jgi:hypothetical protein
MALLAPVLLASGAACTAVVRSAPLASRLGGGAAAAPEPMFLSTGGAPRPFRTLGFIQVTGFGQTVAGALDLGDTSFDGTVRYALSAEAARLGGNGVINIEFLDEDPPTPAERTMDLAKTANNQLNGRNRGEVESRKRRIHVTGEVVRFD